jgi:HD-GYP domain-containing protein (c-di-GMP phosphodiesterase class II)
MGVSSIHLHARSDPDQTVRLSEVISALSHALDLTEGQPVGHAERTCLLGQRLAADIGLTEEERSALFYALLLKDAGCSSSAARMSELFGTDDLELKRAAKTVDWTSPREALRYTAQNVAPASTKVARARRFVKVVAALKDEAGGIVETRCERGAEVVAMLGLPLAASEAVTALEEYWDGSGRPFGLRGGMIPILGRIICLAQTADVFLSTFGREAARDMVVKRRGRWFDPELADLFLAIPSDDAIWGQLDAPNRSSLVWALEPEGHTLVADDSGLDAVAEAFARVIDAKSPFTATHSQGVAAYAVAAGERLELDAPALRDLRRAGLLHDIGKLGISNSILDKPGRLTDAEFAEIRRHPAYSEQILARVPVFARWAVDAAAHHERLDGRGYHRGLDGSQLSRPARILAVADVYEALTADRPYREALAPEEAVAIMRKDVGTAFCPDAFAAIESVARSGAVLQAA